MRGATGTYKCKWCKADFVARVADRNRGWARYCSKSCKAKYQEKQTGANAEFRERQYEAEKQATYDEACAAMEDGWDDHKDTF